MSLVDPDVPPVGEEIHLPGPTLLPFLLAVGITMALIGLTTTVVLVVVGLVIVLWTVIRWLLDTKRVIAQLPLEHADH